MSVDRVTRTGLLSDLFRVSLMAVFVLTALEERSHTLRYALCGVAFVLLVSEKFGRGVNGSSGYELGGFSTTGPLRTVHERRGTPLTKALGMALV
jgi:hypothetical protein